MAISDLLIKQLTVLTQALDEPGADLRAIVAVLHDDVAGAVPSFLGFAMTLSVDGVPVLLTGIDDEDLRSAGSSLRLPLRLAGSPPIGRIVFYAKDRSAFASLGTDAYRIHQLAGEVLLDRDLDQPPGPPDLNGLSDQSDVNQAIGVLIDRGHPPAMARAWLDRDSAANKSSLPEAARRLLCAISTLD